MIIGHSSQKVNKYSSVLRQISTRNKGNLVVFLAGHYFASQWAFFKIYILQGGILDGKLGFILSFYHMMYTVTKYVKLYYLNKSNGQL